MRIDLYSNIYLATRILSYRNSRTFALCKRQRVYHGNKTIRFFRVEFPHSLNKFQNSE